MNNKIIFDYIQKTFSFSMNCPLLLSDDDYSKIDHTYLITIQKKHSILSCLCMFKLNNKNCTVLIKNNQIYNVSINFDDTLYIGTVFIGQYIEKSLNFYIDDIVYHNNKNIQKKSLMQRLNCIYNILKYKYKNHSKSTIQLFLTGYFPFNHIDLVTESCTLIFKNYCNIYQYQYNITNDKHKYIHGDSQICLVTKTDIVDAYKIVQSNELLVVNSINMSNQLKQIFKQKSVCLCQCVYNDYFESWMFLRVI